MIKVIKKNNNEDNKGNKKYSILSSGKKNDIQNNEQISNLEKEISLLKRSLLLNLINIPPDTE